MLFGQNPDETEMTLFRNKVPEAHWIWSLCFSCDLSLCRRIWMGQIQRQNGEKGRKRQGTVLTTSSTPRYAIPNPVRQYM